MENEFQFKNEELPKLQIDPFKFKYNVTTITFDGRPLRLADAAGMKNGGEEHPWKTSRASDDAGTPQLFVSSGRVIEDNVTTFESPALPGGAFALIVPDMVVFLELTKEEGTGVLTGAVVKAEAFVPVDTDTLEHRIIAEVVVGTHDNGSLYVASIIQRLFEDVRFDKTDDSIGGELHPWKVTLDTVEEGAAATISVAGGTVNTQETFEDFFVEAIEGMTAESGEVTLKISRDSATRALTDAVIELYPTGSFPVSDYNDQYVALAVITMGDDGKVASILQTKFEDLGIFEDMAVVNGEFRLVPLAMHGRTYYEPPV